MEYKYYKTNFTVVFGEYCGSNSGNEFIIVIKNIKEFCKINALINYKENDLFIFESYSLENINSDIKKKILENRDNQVGYVPIGFYKHAMGLFYVKNDDYSFDIFIINTGSGCEYHSEYNINDFIFTKGILRFRNLNVEQFLDGIEVLYYIYIFSSRIPSSYNKNINDCNEELLKKFDEKLVYNIIYEKFNNNKNLSEENFFADLPTQTTGDCTVKSFIYTYIIIDYYGKLDYNIEDYEKIIKVDEPNNIKRALRNFWKFYKKFYELNVNIYLDTLDKKNNVYNEGYYFEESFTNKSVEDNNKLTSLYLIKENIEKIETILKLNDATYDNSLLVANINNLIIKYNNNIINNTINNTSSRLISENKKESYWNKNNGNNDILELLNIKINNLITGIDYSDENDVIQKVKFFTQELMINNIYDKDKNEIKINIGKNSNIKDIIYANDILTIMLDFIFNSIRIKFEYTDFKTLSTIFIKIINADFTYKKVNSNSSVLQVDNIKFIENNIENYINDNTIYFLLLLMVQKIKMYTDEILSEKNISSDFFNLIYKTEMMGSDLNKINNEFVKSRIFVYNKYKNIYDQKTNDLYKSITNYIMETDQINLLDFYGSTNIISNSFMEFIKNYIDKISKDLKYKSLFDSLKIIYLEFKDGLITYSESEINEIINEIVKIINFEYISNQSESQFYISDSFLLKISNLDKSESHELKNKILKSIIDFIKENNNQYYQIFSNLRDYLLGFNSVKPSNDNIFDLFNICSESKLTVTNNFEKYIEFYEYSIIGNYKIKTNPNDLIIYSPNTNYEIIKEYSNNSNEKIKNYKKFLINEILNDYNIIKNLNLFASIFLFEYMNLDKIEKQKDLEQICKIIELKIIDNKLISPEYKINILLINLLINDTEDNLKYYILNLEILYKLKNGLIPLNINNDKSVLGNIDLNYYFSFLKKFNYLSKIKSLNIFELGSGYDENIYKNKIIKINNLIDYKSFILNNLFEWKQIDNLIIGLPITSDKYNLLKFNIIYYHEIFYIVDQLSLIFSDQINDNNFDKNEIISKINQNYYMMQIDKIEENCKLFNVFKLLKSKLCLTLNFEQIVFIKNHNYINFKIPEFDIEFIFNTENNTVKFNNYQVILNIDLDNIEINFIMRLIGNCPNFYILFDELNKSYYILNILSMKPFETPNEILYYPRKCSDIINCIEDDFKKYKEKYLELEYLDELKYYNILKLHYSNMFITFNNDIEIINYIHTIKNHGANYILIDFIKSNCIYQELYSNYKINKDNYNKTNKNDVVKYNLLKCIFDIKLSNFFDNYITSHKKNDISFSFNNLSDTIYIDYNTKIKNIILFKDFDDYKIKKIFTYLYFKFDKLKFNYFNFLQFKITFTITENIINEYIKYKEKLNVSTLTTSPSFTYEYSREFSNLATNIILLRKDLEEDDINEIYKIAGFNTNYQEQKNIFDSYVKYLETCDTEIFYDLDNQKGGEKSVEYIDINISKELKNDYFIEIYLSNNDDKQIDTNKDSYKKINININKFCIIDNKEKNIILNTINVCNNNFSKLLYNSELFLKYSIFVMIQNNLKLSKKIPKKINTTFLMFYYQFYLGGIVRNDQAEIIGKILNNYGFDNLLLEVIKNPYENSIKSPERNLSDKELFKNDKSFQNNPKRVVYNLLMGSGKTKVITPIILIYLYNYINYNIDNYENVILVLPEKLINQSYLWLKYTLTYFLNIKISILDENNLTDHKKTKFIITTDIAIKKYLIAEQNSIDFSKTIVLMDEIDLVIDPILSELNKPNSNKVFINKDVFMTIVDILFYSLDTYNIQNIVDNIMIKLNELGFENYDNFNKYINYIKKNNKNDKSIPEISKPLLKKNEYELYDIIYNIIKVLPIYLSKINRKDYGIVSQSQINYSRRILTAIPFLFAETPIIDSEFNDIILTLVLTINCYIEQKELEFYNFYQIIKLLNKQLSKLELTDYKNNYIYNFLSNIFKKNDLIFDIESFCSNNYVENEINDDTNINNKQSNIDELFEYLHKKTKGKINEILKDFNLKIVFCKEILYEEIYYYEKQDTISGIDIVNSYYFKYLNGFTGTPEDKFKFLDDNPLKILPKTVNSINLENSAILNNCKVINYTINKNEINKYQENYNFINWLITTCNLNLYNVIIDVGAIFINIAEKEIAQIIFDSNKNINRFIYFDSNDNPKMIYKGNNEIYNWDFVINDSDFVYFDNPHITGIDIKLKPYFKALITLRKNSRYRDFIQGLYRMRQINSTQTAEIIFMPNVYEVIIIDKENLPDIINIDISNEKLIEILKYSDDYYFNNQMFYFNMQSLRCLISIYKHKYNLIQDYVKKLESDNKYITSYEISNPENYYLNDTDLNKLTKNYEEYLNNKLLISIKKLYEFIHSNIELFNKFIFNDKLKIKKTYEKIVCSDFIKSFINNSVQTRSNLNVNFNVNTNVNLIISQSKIIHPNISKPPEIIKNYNFEYKDYLDKSINNVFNNCYNVIYENNNYKIVTNLQNVIPFLIIYIPNLNTNIIKSGENFKKNTINDKFFNLLIIDYWLNIFNIFKYFITFNIQKNMIIYNVYGEEIFNFSNTKIDENSLYLIKQIKYFFLIKNNIRYVFMPENKWINLNLIKYTRKDLKKLFIDNKLANLIISYYESIDFNFLNSSVILIFITFLSTILYNIKNIKFDKEDSNYEYLLEVTKIIICTFILNKNLNMSENEIDLIIDIDIFVNQIYKYFEDKVDIKKFYLMVSLDNENTSIKSNFKELICGDKNNIENFKYILQKRNIFDPNIFMIIQENKIFDESSILNYSYNYLFKVLKKIQIKILFEELKDFDFHYDKQIFEEINKSNIDIYNFVKSKYNIDENDIEDIKNIVDSRFWNDEIFTYIKKDEIICLIKSFDIDANINYTNLENNFNDLNIRNLYYNYLKKISEDLYTFISTDKFNKYKSNKFGENIEKKEIDPKCHDKILNLLYLIIKNVSIAMKNENYIPIHIKQKFGISTDNNFDFLKNVLITNPNFYMEELEQSIIKIIKKTLVEKYDDCILNSNTNSYVVINNILE